MDAANTGRRRIGLIDIVRGLTIVGMVVFHLLFDIVAFLDAPSWIVRHPLILAVRDAGAGLFILLAGTNAAVTRRGWMHCLTLAACALGVTATTYIFNPKMADVFGVLHFYAAAIAIYLPFRQLLARVPKALRFALFGAAFAVTYILLPITVQVPFLFMFGLPDAAFFSSDYYPLLPWLFVFLAGTTLGEIIFRRKLPEFFYTRAWAPVRFVSRHSLIIYLAHQPLIMLAIMPFAK